MTSREAYHDDDKIYYQEFIFTAFPNKVSSKMYALRTTGDSRQTSAPSYIVLVFLEYIQRNFRVTAPPLFLAHFLDLPRQPKCTIIAWRRDTRTRSQLSISGLMPDFRVLYPETALI